MAKKKSKTPTKHTIKVFTVFDPNGDAHLEYIRQNDDTPSDVGPGRIVTFVAGTKMRWKAPQGSRMKIHFDDGSPFDSGDTDLSIVPPATMTAKETVKQDVAAPGGGIMGFGSSGFRVGDFQSFGSVQVRTFSRKYCSSRNP